MAHRRKRINEVYEVRSKINYCLPTVRIRRGLLQTRIDKRDPSDPRSNSWRTQESLLNKQAVLKPYRRVAAISRRGFVPPMTAATALNNRFGTQIDSSCVQREAARNSARDSFGGGKRSTLIFINQIGPTNEIQCMACFAFRPIYLPVESRGAAERDEVRRRVRGNTRGKARFRRRILARARRKSA